MLFTINILFKVYSVLFMIIPDCDETFNYWEPLNLLLRGFGKQTWEYSPEFAIRSYCYLLPYYLLTIPIKYIQESMQLPSYIQFYFVRSLLVAFTLYSEYKLYESLARINKSVSKWYIFLTAISTGMAHAGVALLPSSFAMQCVNLSIASALRTLDSKSSHYLVLSLTWLMIGGIIGWPFILILAIPFGLLTLYERTNITSIIVKSTINLITILSIIIVVDSFFYKKMVLVPLNIVLYNVFGQEGEGPEIFGVEPFSYYVQNLLLNFNVIAILGYLNVLLVRFNKVWYFINAPLIIWSVIFGTQAHKEERFLYPIYSLIIINAAFIIEDIFALIKRIFTHKLVKLAKYSLILMVTIGSISRTINLVENYSAPLTVSRALVSVTDNSESLFNVCVGREWYHFPTSFFLPENYRLRFIRSGFDGLLPGDFQETGTLFDQTSHHPQGMNNKNIFSDSTVIPFEECQYFIDNSGKTNGQEPDILSTYNNKLHSIPGWDIIKCQKLINTSGTHGIGRLVYIPVIFRTFIPYNVEYMDLCLVKQSN